MEDSNNIEDEVVEVTVSKAKKVKNFVRKNRAPIAVVVAGGVGFGLGMKLGYIEVDKLEQSLRRLRGEFEENYEELSIISEFVDHRKLRDAYVKYAADARALG